MRLIATNGHVMAAWIMRKTKFIGDIDHITVIPSQLLTTIRPLVWSNLRDVRKYNDLNVVIDIDVKPNGGDTDCIRIGFSMRDNLEPCPNMGQISLRSIGGPFPYYQKVCRFTAPESAGENGPVAANGFYLQKAIKFFGHNESVDIVI